MSQNVTPKKARGGESAQNFALWRGCEVHRKSAKVRTFSRVRTWWKKRAGWSFVEVKTASTGAAGGLRRDRLGIPAAGRWDRWDARAPFLSLGRSGRPRMHRLHTRRASSERVGLTVRHGQLAEVGGLLLGAGRAGASATLRQVAQGFCLSQGVVRTGRQVSTRGFHGARSYHREVIKAGRQVATRSCQRRGAGSCGAA